MNASAAVPAVPMEKIKESMRATWMAGDFGVVAKTISKGAEEFVGVVWSFRRVRRCWMWRRGRGICRFRWPGRDAW